MPPLSMRYRHSFLVALVIAFSAAWGADAVRIDGTSPEAFAESQRRLTLSLAPGDAALLAASEAMICAVFTPKPVKYGANGLPVFVPLESMRSKLNGMTFDDIVNFADTLPQPSIEGPPRTSSEPNKQ
jgi:hypothetical protein